MKKIITALKICSVLIALLTWSACASNSNVEVGVLSENKADLDMRIPISSADLQNQPDNILLDSLPLKTSFNEAFKMALGDFYHKVKVDVNIDYFELERQSDNNVSLDYCITKYFNGELNLSEGEVISSVNGIDRMVSSVEVYNTESETKAIHKIYDENKSIIGEFTTDAIGFESSENVNLCSGGKLVVDNISGQVNGKSIIVYNDGEIYELKLENKFNGVAIRCVDNVIYIIATSESNTVVLVDDGREIVPFYEVENFEASQHVAISMQRDLMILNDINSGRTVSINTKLKEVTELKVTGRCSVYETDNQTIIVGVNERTSSVSFIDARGKEVYSNMLEGVFLGFYDNSEFEEITLLFFNKKQKIINTYKFRGSKVNEDSIRFSQYRNFDELIFIWNERLVDLKTAFGLNK